MWLIVSQVLGTNGTQRVREIAGLDLDAPGPDLRSH